MEHGSGQWNTDANSNYTITAVSDTSILNGYYISEENYEGTFGTKDVLSSVGGGTERFYVMALEDIEYDSKSFFTWYNAAYGKLPSSNNEANTVTALGKGKENTAFMIEKWNEKAYGNQNTNNNYLNNYLDVWGVIQKSELNIDLDTWYVPSRAEWSAFGDFCYTKLNPVMTTSNYNSTFGLSDCYWSSSQRNANAAWNAYFDDGYVTNDNVNNLCYVRLGATF